MGGFFPINPGGGVGGGQNPDTAFVGVQLNGDNLVFTRGNGQTTNVSLSVITNGLVEDVELNANGTDLTIIKKDGSTKTVNLTPLLGVREFSYDNNTRVITVIDQNGNRVEVDLSKFARLDEDNIFSGDSNIFKELSLGLPNKTNYIIPSGTYGPAVTQIKTGNRAITSHTVATSNGYVKNLVARVDNVTLGEKINVNIWEVTKGQDRSQDVPKLLHSNLEVEVISSTGYFTTGFAIKCPINKKYNKETYFIYQILQPAKIFRATNINPTSDDYIRIDENADVTTAAIILSRNDLVGVYLLELGDVNIGDLLGNNNGTVTSVNGQAPNDLGVVTVDAEHINYDNATSQLNSTDVQGAIDEVDGKIQNTYVESNFNPVNGELTLTKTNGQDDVLDLSSLLFDVTFDDTNNTLNKVQNGVTTPVIDHVVTEWDDLEFVSKTKGDIRNIFNKHTQIVKNKYFTPVTNGHEIRFNADWDLAYIPIVAGQQVTIVKNVHDSRNYCVCNAQNRIYEAFSVNNTTVNGMYVYHITIGNNLPQDEDCYLAVNMHKTGNNPVDPNKVMVFNGDIANDDLPKEYIPYATHGSIFIDGSEVVHTFNPQGSTLVSQNTQDAIIELDNKITIINESSVKTVNNQRPDDQGNIQVEIDHITGLQIALDGKVDTIQLSPTSQPNKVPQLDQNGKLDTAMIPDLSINQVHSVRNEQEALDLITNGTASIGHVFILTDNQNSVHMYVNQAGNGFNDKCVQLTMSNGAIVSVNRITGDSTGNVTINANQINLQAKPTVTVEQELGKKVSTINSVAPDAQGNIDLELGVASDKLQLKVNNTEKSTLNLYTDAEANGLIAYFI